MISSLSDEGSIDDMLDAIKLLLNTRSPHDEQKAPRVSWSQGTEKKGTFVAFKELGGSYSWSDNYNMKQPVLAECRTRSSTSSESDLVETPLESMKFQGSNIPPWEQQAPYNTMTLPDVFKLLETEDQDCIICVKKIHKLGFKSVKILRQYFSQFGGISRIVVLPSRQKEVGCYDGSSRFSVRPASMCFIVLTSRLACRRILLQELHYVGGEWPVEVSVFVKGASNSPHESYASASTAASVSY